MRLSSGLPVRRFALATRKEPQIAQIKKPRDTRLKQPKPVVLRLEYGWKKSHKIKTKDTPMTWNTSKARGIANFPL